MKKKEGMVLSAVGLLAGIKMKGAIPFRKLTPTFSATNYLNFYYNVREGDIYIDAKYTVRGHHSLVAARQVNYYKASMNPAFGRKKEEVVSKSQDYLEVPNEHSAIFSQAFLFPSQSTRSFISA